MKTNVGVIKERGAKMRETIMKNNLQKWDNAVLPLVKKIYESYDELLPLLDDMGIDCHELYDVIGATNPNLKYHYEALKTLIGHLNDAKSPLFLAV